MPTCVLPLPQRACRARVLLSRAAAGAGKSEVSTSDGGATKRPMTRKRMMDALLKQSADKVLAAAPPGRRRGPNLAQELREEAEEEEVLDLSAFLAQSDEAAEEDEEGAADSWGGGEEDDEEGDEVLDLDALGGASEGAEGSLLNTWSYDSQTDQVVFRRVAPPARRGGPAADSSPSVSALLARLERDTPSQQDQEEEEEDLEEDEDFDAEAVERSLDAPLRIKTSLQLVDSSDADAVIDALGAFSRFSLDKESQAVVDEELRRKLREREKLQKRVVDRDNAPPQGARRTHRQLQIILGSAANYKLWSPQDMNTRPMMSAVRAAVFSMLTALTHGSGQTGGTFPGTMRWLDLFAGTGAVGIEALSRGAAGAHFVELDPWVITNCLRRNLEHTRTGEAATVHAMTVEAFIAEAEKSLRLAGGAAFDFISVCPPYEKVSYPELMASLERSPLVKPGTLLVVEYPKYEKKANPERLGRLAKIRDRAYGRTFVAVYECVQADESLLSESRAAEADAADFEDSDEYEPAVR